jgi:hypothetical protein
MISRLVFRRKNFTSDQAIHQQNLRDLEDWSDQVRGRIGLYFTGPGKTTVTDADLERMNIVPSDGMIVIVFNETDGTLRLAARGNTVWNGILLT